MNDISLSRTIAIVGHGGSGKTSLTEAILFNSKSIERLGRVTEGTTTMDYEPEEIKRKASINIALGHYTYKKHNIHFIDTPGDDNFLSDTIAGLRAVDSVVMVVDAVDGVKVQGEKVWNFVQNYGLPAIILVNKMDRDRANFTKSIDIISKILAIKTVLLQIPLGVAENFRGVIDLLSNKTYFCADNSESMSIDNIPTDIVIQANTARETLIEDITETDEFLMERYLANEEITSDELATALAKGVHKKQFIPVILCSALKNIGIQPLMNCINQLLPSPIQRGAIFSKIFQDNSIEKRYPNPIAPLSGIVFKTIIDSYSGRLSMFRIFSGKLSTDIQLLNPNKNIKERFSQLYIMTGKNQKTIIKALPGDLVAIPKLKDTTTGDTLCDEKNPIIYPEINPLPAVISYAIEANDKGEDEKTFIAINKLLDEDPTLRLTRDKTTGETILSGMGSVHIETIQDRLRRKFNIEITLKIPKVPYCETIKGKTRVQGRYKKQTGGRGQFGDTWLEIEPNELGKGFIFLDEIVGGAIPRNYIPAVEKGILEVITQGVYAGYPMVDIKVHLVDGSYHSVDSSEMAFKIAASIGFKKGIPLCKPTILEPIMLLTVTIPKENMGDVIGNISGRRGRILGIETENNLQVIKSYVPMNEILTYQPELVQLTGGRGSFTIKLNHYEEAPSDLQIKLVEAYRKKRDEANS